MIDHDRLFKELLTTFFGDFIALFFPDVAAYLDADTITFLDKELFSDLPGAERREADIVARAQFRGAPAFFLIHVEHQSQPAPDFSRRMFRYFARLYEQYELPVYPIALFSFDAPLREEPSAHQVRFTDLVVLDFQFRTIQLNRLNWRDFLRQPNPIASALMAKMGIAPADRPRVKLECLRLLATLRLDRERARLIARFVDTYLRLTADEQQLFRAALVTITPREQEAVMEITTSWKEEGIQEGIAFGLEQGLERGLEQGLERGLEQGLERGLRQGQRALLQRLLVRRFGALPADFEAQIDVLATPRLEALGEALLDFTTLAELETWLQSNTPGPDAPQQ